MDVLDEIFRALGRIEGELVEIRKLSQRISKLEANHFWLKGAWAVLLGGYAYLFKEAWAR